MTAWPAASTRWQLRDAGIARPELRQGVAQVALVESLEGAADHRTAEKLLARQARAVIGTSEGLGEKALVGDQRKARVDDVEMGVEKGHGAWPGRG